MLLFSIKSFCQAGSLDLSFSMNGKVTTLVGTSSSRGNSVAIQSNGKIIVAGDYLNNFHNNYDFAIVRYNINGTLDKSFAGNGKAGVDFGSNSDDEANSVAIQPTGEIVVIGNSGPPGNIKYLVGVRLKANGDLDNSFGINGKVKIPFAGRMKSLAIQPDGKFVIAGDTGYNNDRNFALLRLTSDGTLDNSFGRNGTLSIDFYGEDDEANSVALQSNGKIVVGGFTVQNGIRRFAIARFHKNGTFDSSFGKDGKVTTFVGTTGASGLALDIQPNGKILQAGDFANSKGDGEIAIVRYNIDGTLDNSFAGNGKSAVSFGGESGASSINVQPDGKIIVAGINSINGPDYDIAVARLKKNGTLDNSFGNGGEVTTNFGGNDFGSSMAIQPDGKIVVAGLSITDKYRTIVARYLGDGSSPAVITMNDQTNLIKSTLIKIYPNPVTNVIHLRELNSLITSITISNQLGNVLIQQPVYSGGRGINVSMLKPGAYNLTVLQNNKITNFKFIKQ